MVVVPLLGLWPIVVVSIPALGLRVKPLRGVGPRGATLPLSLVRVGS